MLRLYGVDQMNLWESTFPEELFALSDELAQVDAYLDDERFLAPFIEKFNNGIGRPTVPVATYLRMMYLKFRYQLGYETLVKEISDSLMWRRFCRIPLNERVCDASTLIKLTKKFGPELIAEINEGLVEKAREQKIIRGRKLRLDTTVVEADIHHPTDASLLADGIRAITKTVKKITKAADVATRFVDKTRSCKKRLLAITKTLRKRSGEAVAEVRAITRDVMRIAREVSAAAQGVLDEVKELPQVRKALIEKLQSTISLTEKIIEQTRKVEAKEKVTDRIVSLYDAGARPIRKGKLAKDTEFGYKVIIAEAERGIITGYGVFKGNPPDEGMLTDVVEQHTRLFGRVPGAVAADRGFYSQDNETALKDIGVKKISIPKRGRISAERKAFQSTHQFKRLQRFRAGSEATISLLKRKYGLRRSLFRGDKGTKAWVGFGVFARNLQKIATIKAS